MEQTTKEKKVIVPIPGKNGGARPGSGRPKGSGNKITAQHLIDEAHRQLGKPFEQSLIEGYAKSVAENNTRVRYMYEQLIINKVLADRQQIEVTDSAEAVEAKKAAFAEALKDLTTTK